MNLYIVIFSLISISARTVSQTRLKIPLNNDRISTIKVEINVSYNYIRN